MVAAISAHAYGFEVDGIYYYEESDTSVSVGSPSYNFYSGDIVIPSKISYNDKIYTVTELGEASFTRCSNLTSVQIPNSVITIEHNAFQNCI